MFADTVCGVPLTKHSRRTVLLCYFNASLFQVLVITFQFVFSQIPVLDRNKLYQTF